MRARKEHRAGIHRPHASQRLRLYDNESAIMRSDLTDVLAVEMEDAFQTSDEPGNADSCNTVRSS